MRTDEAWRAGHRAASRALTVAGLGPIVAAAAVVAKRPEGDTEKILLRAGNGWLLAWLGLATFRASRAARTAETS